MDKSNFRRLRRDELEEVKPQFVKFLAVQGYDASAWQALKENEPGVADGLILQFSQTVFQGVIDRIEYLVHRRPNDLRTYRTGPEKIEMRGLLLDGETSVDFTQSEDLSPQEIFDRLKTEKVTPKLYSAERAYARGGRAQDIFLIMEEGALIDQGELFNTLAGL